MIKVYICNMRADKNNEIKYLGEYESINSGKGALTIEKLRTFEGFENTSDEKALEIINTINTLCRIVRAYLMVQSMKINNNPQNLAA
jgi:hypothetical protein